MLPASGPSQAGPSLLIDVEESELEYADEDQASERNDEVLVHNEGASFDETTRKCGP
jgi:hypothetical protein